MFRPRSIALLLVALILPSFLSAQNSQISGTVVRSDSTPIAGAHVQLLDTRQGAVSDAQGNFRLTVSASSAVALRVTHLGYVPVTVTVLPSQESGSSILILLQEAPVDLGAVTVTAMRTQELLRNVPLPLSIVDAAQLQRTVPVSVPDALDGEPGITLVRDGVWGTDVNIRGLGRANVVTLVDGARIETATNHAAGLSLIDVTDIERIEVIRGAASTLYGTGATGGVVNVITGDGQFGGDFHLQGTLGGSYSSVNEGSTGSLALEAADDVWFLRLRGTMRSARDANTPEGVLRDSRFHDRSISASAGVQLHPSHELRARYQLFDAQDVGIPGGASFPDQASARYPDERREMAQAEYRAVQISDALDQLSFRVTHQRIDRNVELIPSPAAVLRPSAEHTMNAALLQSNWTLGEHRMVGGFDAWQRTYDGRRLREIRATNTVIADLPLPRARFRSLGAFVQDEWHLADERLLLTLGARADQIHVENDEAYDLLYVESNGVRNDAPANRTLRWPAQQSDEMSWSAHAGLLLRILPALDATLNLSRSFRAPSLEERYQYIELGGATYLGDVNLAAEKGSVVDLGLRLHDAHLAIRGNAFVNAMNDLVVDERRSDTLYVKSNVGKALLYGGELSAEWNPVSTLVLHTAVSYVRGRDTGNDSDLPQMPPFGGRLGLRIPVSGIMSADLMLDAAADQDAVASGEDRTPGYALVHLHLRSDAFRIAGLGVVLFAGVDNVFDRSWRRHLSTLRGLIVTEPGRNMFFRLQLLF
ncbi:MAG: TonB-dependent receptor [Bacteroidetes bacterium]|nr:TonB-dependent receptor [Bacteroidota bacterium]